ncbi:hypothetical protein [Ralstonia pseudosolanacearum]|uniref:Uncharacterized protein n=1 Tax=Ralstonia nicotianae (strain ATCC BAA-1114 / GMI1000) TaxID=267608 RepID=Q8XRV7_RALN1|nr:hypothetical protein [Ralstonia pseudosolanacearum]MDC6283113.1 hypothetical protein [Ralstonia pseudosolanacearum]CAD17875.1 hypothetical protein RSp0724 [Ralstonia pseudosolanacearum GMI1000]
MEQKALEYSRLDSLFVDSFFCIERDSNYDPERSMWAEAIQY